MGADTDAPGEQGQSALMTAVYADHPLPLVRTLIAGGADPHHIFISGDRSPVEYGILRDGVEVPSAMLELGVNPNTRTPFTIPVPPGVSVMDTLWFQDFRKYGGDSLLHFAVRFLRVQAVELLLSAGAREDIPAFSAAPEDPEAIATLPANVIGAEVKELTPEIEDHTNAIKSLLADAKLYRRGWLSILRARFEAGESLTSNTIGGEDAVEIPIRRRQRTAEGSAGNDANFSGQQDDGASTGDVIDEVWYGAAVWLATVPGEQVFRMIVGYI